MNPLPNNQDLVVRPSYRAFGMQQSRGFQQIPYPERPQTERPADDSIGVLEYIRIIRRHRGTIILFAFLGLLVSVLYTMPQTPLYRARTVLEIQDINNDFLNTRSVNPVAQDNSSNVLTDVQTQMKIIQSENLLDRVIQKLKSEGKVAPMTSTSRFAGLKRLLNLPENKNNSEADYALEQLAMSSLTIHQLGQTRVLEVLYTSSDPKFAADFVNTLTTEYVDSNMEARWKMSERTGEWLNGQLDDMRVKLEKSEATLQQYASRSGLLYTTPQSGGTEKTNVSEDKLRQLQESLSRAEADRAAAQSRYEIARGAAPESVGDVLNDESLRDLQDKLTDLNRQRAELISVYTAKHEKVKRVEAQIEPLQAAFDSERAAIISHIRNDYDSARKREKLISSDYNAQSSVVTDQAGKSIQYNILKRDVDSNRQLYESTLQQVKAASVASAIRASNIRIVDAAKAPRAPFSPSLAANSMVGLVGGTFLGVAFILIRSRADRTLRQPGDVAFWTHATELGVIPSAKLEGVRRLAPRDSTDSALTDSRVSQEPVELITWDKKPSLVAEAFRAVLTSILFVGENGSRPKMLVITSCGPGEGKTTVVSNLGIAMAEIRRRVLIVDADMRRPRMHQLFDLANDFGLSTLLRETTGFENTLEAVQETRVPGLFVLTSGPATASAANLLYSQRLPDLLARLRGEFDMVLIDTPPSLQLTDARVLARMTDGVVLVARVGQTTVDATVALHKRFWEDHTRILGTVLNDWNPKASDNGYYGAAAGYSTYQHRYDG